MVIMDNISYGSDIGVQLDEEFFPKYTEGSDDP